LDELNTVLVEGTLNARPLIDEYEEFDGEVLTPSHLKGHSTPRTSVAHKKALYEPTLE
jgi:hypothetical protein